MPVTAIDYNNPYPVTREIYWVGFHDKEANFRCNPYLLIDEKDVVLFDPGSIPHFPIVMRKVIEIINPGEITIIVAHHQDPDVCGNLSVIEDVIDRDDLQIVAHSQSSLLIRHYGLRSSLYDVDEHDYKIMLKSGRVLEFIHTPFLHSPGAIVTYDKKSKSLFSSDIFGAESENWTLFAGKNYSKQMKSFHQGYMASNKLLNSFMVKLEELQIDRILPQHGSILEGNMVSKSINFLKTLPCGADLIKE